MDEAAIVALLSSIEPSEGEIPKPPFMAAISAGPVIEAGADVAAVDAWVKARGGWTHRTPAHLAGPEGERAPLFFIVPKGHLTAGGGGASALGVVQAGRGPGSQAPAAARVPASPPVGAAPSAPPRPSAPIGGLAGAPLMAFAATTDLGAARAFYQRALGLPLTGESPIACTFDAGGTTLRVNTAETVIAAPYTVLGWTVTDIAATVGDLKARGVDFERFDGVEQDALGIWSAPGGALVAWFKDPDDNMLSLT
ncbi:MAG: hypothetical protein QOJ89_2867, partial [bacterium]